MSDLEQKIYAALADAVKSVCGIDADEDTLLVEAPRDPKLGDYATSTAMRLARTLHKSPMEIGEALAEKLREAMRDVASRHPQLADVRGAGLFNGVEVVRPGTLEADRPFAVQLIERLRENRVLISLCGPYGNVLKVRPPLVFDDADLDFFASALETSLEQLER